MFNFAAKPKNKSTCFLREIYDYRAWDEVFNDISGTRKPKYTNSDKMKWFRLFHLGFQLIQLSVLQILQ